MSGESRTKRRNRKRTEIKSVENRNDGKIQCMEKINVWKMGEGKSCEEALSEKRNAKKNKGNVFED